VTLWSAALALSVAGSVGGLLVAWTLFAGGRAGKQVVSKEEHVYKPGDEMPVESRSLKVLRRVA